MADERIFATRYAKHPTATIAAATHARLPISTVEKVDQGPAGATGRQDALVTDRGIVAEVYGIDPVFSLVSATHNDVAVADLVFARLTPTTRYRLDPGAADSPGPADAVVTYYELAVELFGLDYQVMLALLEDSAADVVCTIKGAAGASQTATITNVYFSQSIGAVEFPAVDGGGKLEAFGIRGYVNFGADETFADVVTADPTGWTGMLAKIGAASANLVLGAKGAAGANRTHTVKNVAFVEATGSLELPAKDVGGTLSDFGIRGPALWGDADTFATMLIAAPDS